MPCVLTASCPLCASGRPWIEPIASCSRCLSYLLPCPALPTIMDCISSTSPSKPVFPSLAFQVFAHTNKESMNSLDSLHSQLAPSFPPFFLCCLSFFCVYVEAKGHLQTFSLWKSYTLFCKRQDLSLGPEASQLVQAGQ